MAFLSLTPHQFVTEMSYSFLKSHGIDVAVGMGDGKNRSGKDQVGVKWREAVLGGTAGIRRAFRSTVET